MSHSPLFGLGTCDSIDTTWSPQTDYQVHFYSSLILVDTNHRSSIHHRTVSRDAPRTENKHVLDRKLMMLFC